MADNIFTNNGFLNTQRETRNDIRTANNALTPANPSENTLLQTSTNITIWANSNIVGMIQSFSITENRTINKLQAIGWEGVVQAVPGNTQGGQLSVTRIALYESNLWNALGLDTSAAPYNPLGKKFGPATATDWDNSTHTAGKPSDASIQANVSSGNVFKTLKDQRVPFEIQVKTPVDATNSYVETYIDCWLASYSKSYTVGTITVAETATIQYADVY
jgi:hypothetical protein